MNEMWKSVVGYEGLYEVSNLGSVRSAKRRCTKGGVLRQATRIMIYKGWNIEEETNPWAKLFGIKFKFFIDGERVYSADSFEDAVAQIEEIEAPIFI